MTKRLLFKNTKAFIPVLPKDRMSPEELIGLLETIKITEGIAKAMVCLNAWIKQDMRFAEFYRGTQEYIK